MLDITFDYNFASGVNMDKYFVTFVNRVTHFFHHLFL